MVTAEEKSNISPICPHCEKEIETLWYNQVKTFLGKRFIYFCSSCRKTLGVSHRKGFWMG
jgi:uncharacterized protein with PIN domain